MTNRHHTNSASPAFKCDDGLMLWNAILVLGIATLITALMASYYWYKSSIVPVNEVERPKASVDDSPAAHILTADFNLEAVRYVLRESSRLNKLAARWTGVSALLGAFTTFAGMFH